MQQHVADVCGYAPPLQEDRFRVHLKCYDVFAMVFRISLDLLGRVEQTKDPMSKNAYPPRARSQYEIGHQQVGRAQPTGIGPQTHIDRPYLCTYISCTLGEYEGLEAS